jgi:acyl-CoA thioesterase I
MKRFIYACALFFSCITSTAAQSIPIAQPTLTPLYSSNFASLTDNFYTTNPEHHSIALSIGYTNTGILAYMKKTQVPNTRPFKRFYKGAPQYEHFYTAKTDEANFVLANGWVYEGVEGYIYTIQVPGSTPMYRLAYFNSSNSDLVHKYTLNYQEVQQLVAQGWGYDGIQGYVYGANTYTRVDSCGINGGALRVMPLGDSITEAMVDPALGANQNSYRRPLWHNLKNAGCQVDFVGSKWGVIGKVNSGSYGYVSPPNPDFDLNHEGHWGLRIDQIAPQVTNYVHNASPDVVLIHLGTNDITHENPVNNENPDDVAQELGGLIDTIRAAKPDVRILLAKLIPDSRATAGGITSLNAKIDAVVAVRNNSPSYPRVIVVDQASGYAIGDNYDGTHPKLSGETKIATRWSQAILALRTP